MCADSLLSRVQQRGAHHGDRPSRHALTSLAKTDVVQARPPGGQNSDAVDSADRNLSQSREIGRSGPLSGPDRLPDRVRGGEMDRVTPFW